MQPSHNSINIRIVLKLSVTELHVKVAPPMGGIPGIPKDTGDEESGENKKERDAAPTGLLEDPDAAQEEIA